jgi:arabinan endo-1,5-alpha-L-arabinosidase
MKTQFHFHRFFGIAILSLFMTHCGSERVDYNPGISDDYSHLTDIHHYRQWGVYNVHDPSCIKADDGYFYLYSTDAIYLPEGAVRESDTIQTGYIQIRRSPDLVNWEFVGWAFDEIPREAIEHIREASDGREPRNLWAPYIKKWKDEYRLYYSASVFGANTSFIGLAKSQNPIGPWGQVGKVVKTFANDSPNAIDPSVVTDPVTQQQWMHYGSYFGGMYVVELNPETGLALQEGDLGHVVAQRAEGDIRIIEAPEIIYNPDQEKYYYFVSYDPLFSHYNIRVGRSDKPQGPFFDYFGKDMAEPENNFPVITYPYRFSGHPGWAGVGHNAVLNDNGKYYVMHQGRLAPGNHMMVLHVREVFWTDDGWPVVSPQRYAGVPQTSVSRKELVGIWEEIRLEEVRDTVTLWQGQIPPGGWHYDTLQFNNSLRVTYLSDGTFLDQPEINWSFQGGQILLKNKQDGDTTVLIVFRGGDWENNLETVLYSGISSDGFGIWGKRIDPL